VIDAWVASCCHCSETTTCPVLHFVACVVEKETVSIGVVEISSDHSKVTAVLGVVEVCANGLTKANDGHDGAVETWSGYLRASDRGLATYRGDPVPDRGRR
jgi:hypothetical protein